MSEQPPASRVPTASAPGAASALPDLAARSFGGAVLWANDEFFAGRENLVTDAPPTFTPRTFGAKGQVYDGWETRRRREPGVDQAIVRLGAAGVVRFVVVDTSFFTGNYPTAASVEAVCLDGSPSVAALRDADWTTLVPRSDLQGDTANSFPVRSARRWTHVRLTIHPDGGVARLRVHGEVLPDPDLLARLGTVDLAAAEHGGRVIGCSNEFYGHPDRMLAAGPARSMGEGWETARRRDEGNDWVEVRLGLPGSIRLVELDTSWFIGNAPGAAALAGRGGPDDAWRPLLPRTPLQPDTRHRFPLRDSDGDAVSDVRLDIYPDGGMARLRVWGQPTPEAMAALRGRWAG